MKQAPENYGLPTQMWVWANCLEQIPFLVCILSRHGKLYVPDILLILETEYISLALVLDWPCEVG